MGFNMLFGRLFFPLLSSVVPLFVRARYLSDNVMFDLVTFDNCPRGFIFAVFNFRALPLP
jgi:hypothetical protein